MSTVLAVREESYGTYFGFQVDAETLECSECEKPEAYRLRYTKDLENNLAEHRLAARCMIKTEHPKHSDKFRVG